MKVCQEKKRRIDHVPFNRPAVRFFQRFVIKERLQSIDWLHQNPLKAAKNT